jgi:hypothetical protein
VSDISAPAWGKQVGIKLDTPVNGVPYFHYLHLSAVNPNLQLGQRVNIGDLVGWVGGGTTQAMYQGTTNPTGQNFLNDSFSSSQIQVGIALMRGPAYGGPGWQNFPPIDMTLDPTPILNAARNSVQKGNYMEQQFDAVWLSGAGVHADGTSWVARKSGIYEGTKAAFLAGKLAACCPTRDEIKTVDWSGGAGIYQPLSTGDYAFYQNGHPRIYDNRNHVIWG